MSEYDALFGPAQLGDLNLCAYGDLHGDWFTPPADTDITFLCGDIAPDLAGKRVAHEQFAWMRKVFCQRERLPGTVLAVAGNHDTWHTDAGFRLEILDKTGIRFLHNEVATVLGLTVYGTPVVWSFGGSLECRQAWDLAPRQPDVVLAHCTPYGMGDWCNGHVGDPILTKRINEVVLEPKLFLCGHQHDTPGFWVWKESLFVNATSGLNRPGHAKPHAPRLLRWRGGQPAVCGLAGWREAAAQVAGRYRYERHGYGVRHLRLEPNGAIGEGAAGCERGWRMDWRPGQPLRLVITTDQSRGGDIMKLEQMAGAWQGQWLAHERCPVTLNRVGD